MGIRPNMYLIVGIDDATPNDPRRFITNREEYEEILHHRPLEENEFFSNDHFNDYHYFVQKVPGFTNFLYDKLYNPELLDEYSNGNVIGFIRDKLDHDSDIFRALACLDEKYMQAGWERIPLMDPAAWWVRTQNISQEDIDCNMLTSGVLDHPIMNRIYWERAIHYLKLVGWNIPKKDLRYLLVWDWS